MALRTKPFRQRIGLAKQSQSTTTDWLCKASQSVTIGWFCEANPMHPDKLAFRSKAIPSGLAGFAIMQSQTFTMERLCDAKPIRKKNRLSLRSNDHPPRWLRLCKAQPIRHIGLALLRKANPQYSNTMGWLCFAKPIHRNMLALRSKSYPPRWIGFAKHSQSVTMDWLCKGKPIQHDVKALRSNANPAKKTFFEAKPIRHNEKTLQSKAN